MEGEELSKRLLDQLMFVLVQRDIPDLQGIKNRFQMALANYQIQPKEEALAVYTEGKNVYFLKKFLLAKAVAGRSKRTLQQYQTEIRRALEAMGKDADTLTSEDIQVHLAKVMQASSKIYADNVRRVLSTFFAFLFRDELIQKNPMNRVETIKLQKKKKPAFSEMDVELIREACRNNKERCMVEVLLSTGCRVTELVNMKVDEIENGTIGIIGKGDKFRTVYLNAKAQVAIRAYISERSDANPYLFPRMKDEVRNRGCLGNRNGYIWWQHPDDVDVLRHCDACSVEGIVRNIGKRAGVEKVHPHRFRRTCATFALRRGMPIEQVSKMLGHENLSTTQIYLDLTEEELASAHKKYVV